MKTPSNRYSERVIEKLKLKKLSYVATFRTRHEDGTSCVTRLSGKTKNDFIDDCLKRGLTESVVLRCIIELHYANKSYQNKEFEDILKILSNNPNINSSTTR